jgi:hypothetical protein
MDGGIVAPGTSTASPGGRARDRTTGRGFSMAAPQAYCVKCKEKREMQDATVIEMKNGRPATQGKCPVCGTKMFKIGAA